MHCSTNVLKPFLYTIELNVNISHALSLKNSYSSFFILFILYNIKIIRKNIILRYSIYSIASYCIIFFVLFYFNTTNTQFTGTRKIHIVLINMYYHVCLSLYMWYSQICCCTAKLLILHPILIYTNNNYYYNVYLYEPPTNTVNIYALHTHTAIKPFLLTGFINLPLYTYPNPINNNNKKSCLKLYKQLLRANVIVHSEKRILQC